MRLVIRLAVCVIGVAVLSGESNDGKTRVPAYTQDGRLVFQHDYRQWTYLSSGLDMSYSPRARNVAAHHIFDNVFVNPEAYDEFMRTGTWPDKTMLVLEVRGAENKGSINRAGYFQSESVMGVEVHVKDAARGGWAFYQFDSPAAAKMVPKGADCYSCHRDHGAVDTTFVQFYPTLIRAAKQTHTFRADVVNGGTTSAR